MHVNERTQVWVRTFCKSARSSGLGLLSLTVLLVTATAASGQTHNQHPMCQAIAAGKIQASSGAQMWCFGRQPNGPNLPLHSPTTTTLSGFGFTANNVDAASLAEDVNGAGVRADGQSEVSIAAAGPFVVEAWNDSTGFISPCPSPKNKEELTGFAFSSDGGKTFTDLGGPPNAECANFLFEGDPSVEVYQKGGNTYFYLASLYPTISFGFAPLNNNIAITPCHVKPGPPASLSCGQPVIAATSSECAIEFGFFFCSFLDKDFLTIDAAHARLYVSYTEFGFVAHPNDIELAACDLTRPMAPVCSNGSQVSVFTPQPDPYLVVAPADNINGCEREGAYPAADPATGDVYVAHEYNWFTNFLSFLPCSTIPTLIEVAHVPGSNLTLPLASGGPDVATSIPITSMDLTFVPGYNRFPPNDFPRIAVSDAHGTVSVVWNDAGRNPLGDILLQSFNLGTLTAVQPAPVRLNTDTGIGTLHFMPALRNVDAHGNLNVSWFDRRRSPSTAYTDVFAALEVHPRTTSTPSFNTRVTNVSSNWLSNSSIIIPNFGDYTDNYVRIVSGTATLFAAWSDGRYTIPQPFNAHQLLK